MDEEDGVPLRSAPPARSLASSNWRVKDGTPRADRPPRRDPQTQNQRGDNRKPFHDRRDAPSVSSRPGTRLYVGNLLYTVQREDIETFFGSNGFPISGMSMSIDPFTGRNPSYAFVDFETPDEANNAMETLNGTELLGRPVKINAGVAKSGQGNGFQSRVKNYDRGWGKKQEHGQGEQSVYLYHYGHYGHFYALERRFPFELLSALFYRRTDQLLGVPTLTKFGTVENHSPTFDRWTRNDAPSHFASTLQNGCRLFVGDLPRIEPQAAVDAEMQQLFSGFELTAVSKIINPLRNDPERATEQGNHHFCFVDLTTSEEADQAMAEVNKKPGSWGGAVRVAKAKDKPNRKVFREQGDTIRAMEQEGA